MNCHKQLMLIMTESNLMEKLIEVNRYWKWTAAGLYGLSHPL